jgi:hypothetical protein
MSTPTVVGTQIPFGISGNYASLEATTSVQSVSKRDKKELKGSSGSLQAIAFFNPTTEYTIEGYGTVSGSIGASISIDIPTANGSSGQIIIEEVTYSYSNEDFRKSSLKAVQYHDLSG